MSELLLGLALNLVGSFLSIYFLVWMELHLPVSALKCNSIYCSLMALIVRYLARSFISGSLDKYVEVYDAWVF